MNFTLHINFTAGIRCQNVKTHETTTKTNKQKMLTFIDKINSCWIKGNKKLTKHIWGMRISFKFSFSVSGQNNSHLMWVIRENIFYFSFFPLKIYSEKHQVSYLWEFFTVKKLLSHFLQVSCLVFGTGFKGLHGATICFYSHIISVKNQNTERVSRKIETEIWLLNTLLSVWKASKKTH